VRLAIQPDFQRALINVMHSINDSKLKMPKKNVTNTKKIVKKILIITLSNIGDAVLTMPVLAQLSVLFPDAEITVLCAPRAVSVYIDDGRISELVIYDKHISLISKICLLRELRAGRFDLVVDFKNTLIPILIKAKRRTSFWRRPPRNIVHKQDVHLWKLKSLGLDITQAKTIRPVLRLNESDWEYVDSASSVHMTAMAPGAMSHLKLWPQEYYIELACRLLKETDIEQITLLGSKQEKVLCTQIEEGITARIKQGTVCNLAGQTTIKQAAAVLTKCRFLVSNDSALMHIGSAVDIPVIALFGPTDENKYKPLSPGSKVIRNTLKCTPCQKAQCRLKTHECLQELPVDDVFKAILSQDLAIVNTV